MHRVKFCGRCGRPITKAGYCLDCLQQIIYGREDIRCTFCGKNKLASKLVTNIKTQKTYCSACLQIFQRGLRDRGFEERLIKKILREDFILLE
ncbi:MAG: hypothetical protein ACFFDI_24185 [Promethearchaeota archaeon]